ncbi:MAG TPA: hypothetical protein VGI46_06855 [Candidatus Acidoferrum sp.]|jgi:hypothetical protein
MSENGYENFLTLFEHRLPSDNGELDISGENEFRKTQSGVADPVAVFEQNVAAETLGMEKAAMPAFEERKKPAFLKCVSTVKKIFAGHPDELEEAVALVNEAREVARAEAENIVAARVAKGASTPDVSAQWAHLVSVDDGQQ